MTAGEYVVGAAFLAVTLGTAALAAGLVIARRSAALDGVSQIVAWALLTALGIFVAHLVPGVFGVLSRGSVAATGLVLLALLWLLLDRLPRAEPAVTAAPEPAPSRPEREWVSRLAGWGSLFVVAVYVVALLAHYADEALFHPDTTSFHIPNVIRWIQEGSLWPVDDFIPDRAPGNYPQTGDVYVLAVMLPFDGDFLVRLVPYPFLALLGASVYAGARELAAARSTAALLAAAVIGMPVVSYAAYVGLADTAMLATFAAGGYFLLRHWRTGDPFDLVLAGVGLGLSLGTRWYAVPAVGAVVLAWLIAARANRRRLRTVVRQGLALAVLIALCGGFWLVRNLVGSGNPVFPVEVAPFGIELFDAPRDLVRERLGDSLSAYVFDIDAWRDYFWDPFLLNLTFIAIALWAALAYTAASAFRARRGPERALAGRALALCGVATLVVVSYLITPYTATGSAPDVPDGAWVNARYVVPALLAAALAATWAFRRAGRGRWIAEALVALAVLDAVRRAFDLPGGYAGRPAALVAIFAVALAFAAVRWAPAVLSWARRHRGLALAAAAGAALVALVAGSALEQRFETKRFEGLSDPYQVVNDEAPTGQNIGLVGEGWGAYPLFGPRLGNDVRFVGRREQEMLRGYEDRGEFAADVREHDYDLVLVQEIATFDKSIPLRDEERLRDLGYVEIAAGPSIVNSAPARLYAPEDSPLAEGAAR